MNEYEKFYLTKESQISTQGKKLLRLSGWRKELAGVLTNSKLTQDQALTEIKHVLSTIPGNNDSDFESYLELLPQTARKRGNILSFYIKKIATFMIYLNVYVK